MVVSNTSQKIRTSRLLHVLLLVIIIIIIISYMFEPFSEASLMITQRGPKHVGDDDDSNNNNNNNRGILTICAYLDL